MTNNSQSTFERHEHAPRLIGPDDLEPLTLGREWELFSGLPACAAYLPVTQINLTETTLCCLREMEIVRLRDLLGQTVASLSARLGDDIAEEILEALITYAAEGRLLPDPRLLLDPMPARDPASVLTERWGPRPVSELHLATEAVQALRRAEIATVSELLAALDPLHVELALDPYAFARIWRALQAVGLREESWVEAGERLRAEVYAVVSLDHAMQAWRSTMAASLWRVASARFGLEGPQAAPVPDGTETNRPWYRPTLDAVGIHFGVTRERVRQIEIRFVKKLQRAPDERFVALQNALAMIVSQAGGVITLEQAAEDFPGWINPGQAAPEGVCRLVLNHSALFVPLQKNALYALANQPHSLYPAIVAFAKEIAKSRPGEIALAELAAEIVRDRYAPTGDPGTDAALPTEAFVLACLEASGELGPGLSLMGDAALVRLLRELGSPRHFTELAERLNEKGWRKRTSSAKYVHNQLLYRRDLFVYVSAGTYGLAAWGLEDVRVERGGALMADLIVAFLEARGVPASREEIVAHVLARKNCREGSIIQRLYYDDRFCQTTKNQYGLSRWTF